MIRDTAVSIIANRLGQRSGLDSQIVAEMQLAQAELEKSKRLPWFLLYLDESLATVNGTRTVNLPTGFLREEDDLGLWLISTDLVEHELVKDEFRILNADENLTGSGQSTHYSLVGRKLYLFKKPDAAYSLKFWYYKADELLDSNRENQWLAEASDLLIARTGVQVAKFLRDKDAVQAFADDLALAYERLLQEDVARDMAGRKLEMGG